MKKTLIFSLFIFCALIGHAQLPGGLKAYFPLNYNYDDTTGALTVVNNGTSFENDRNGAIRCNSTGGAFLNLGTDLSAATFSISAWLKPDKKNDAMVFLSNWYNFSQYDSTSIEYRLAADGTIDVVIGNATNVPSSYQQFLGKAKLVFNQWNHVSIVLDDCKRLKIFINGKLDKSYALSGITFHQSPNRMYLGCRAAPTNESPYYGLIDEVMLFGKALNDTEAFAIYTYTNGIEKQTDGSSALKCVCYGNEIKIICEGGMDIQQILLADMQGKTVWVSCKNESINTENISEGIYLLSVVSDRGVLRKKVFVGR